ncbi:SDR family oxidoreductase [Flavobacteriaceae bacterium S356]|uniref:dTDP-4-dehydrorhamnose reductase n=1 Tax=Asprobacillus argus TaxID=3076534 RepID=A0ABU3LHY4_9FLAO|nr:SDR family oxidoreductase [Flavobacteriaceae bacterium S356]
MKKVVVTGANGLLGQTLINLLLKDNGAYEVFGVSRGANRTDRTDFTYIDIDITKHDQLQNIVIKFAPDFIVNTAAMTNVDACEGQKEACTILNVDVVKNLAEISVKSNAHLIHISTDFIFDGEKGYYKETDTPNPLSYYGWSKLKSEQVLAKSNASYSVLRTILVYGLVNNMSRNNIVLWVKDTLESGKEITIVDDQYRMPTYVEDLAMACKIAMDKKAQGVYNISSNTLLSIYEMVLQIAEAFHLNKDLVKPISTATLNQVAKRPPKTGFDLSKTNRELGFYPKSFQEDLQRFKDSLI